LDVVKNDLKKMDVRSWKKMARDRHSWEFNLKEVRVLHGS